MESTKCGQNAHQLAFNQALSATNTNTSRQVSPGQREAVTTTSVHPAMTPHCDTDTALPLAQHCHWHNTDAGNDSADTTPATQHRQITDAAPTRH